MIKHILGAPMSVFQRSGIAVYARHYMLQPADRLMKSIFHTSISKHHSIYLGVDTIGTEWVTENHKFGGFRLVKAEDFFSYNIGISVERLLGCYNDRVAAVKRALKQVRASFDLFSYNCEHCATYVQTGKAKSKQVDIEV